MLLVFSDLIELGHDITFEIAGNWNNSLIKDIPNHVRQRIKFVGKIDNVTEFLRGAVLYLHTARGEAWGISINEAMAAGIIPIVSEWTGAKEVVEQVSEKLVVPLDRNEIVSRVDWLLTLSDESRVEMSHQCKEISAQYPEYKAVDNFRSSFSNICNQVIQHGK
jgi:glycosyltransferase involved in cell wall biosynthesis